MRLHPPDSSLDDYKARRSAFIKAVNAETPRCACIMCSAEGDNSPHWRRAMKERNQRLKAWIEANSPYSPEEKLANLMKAFKDEGIV